MKCRLRYNWDEKTSLINFQLVRIQVWNNKTLFLVYKDIAPRGEENGRMYDMTFFENLCTLRPPICLFLKLNIFRHVFTLQYFCQVEIKQTNTVVRYPCSFTVALRNRIQKRREELHNLIFFLQFFNRKHIEYLMVFPI